MDKNKLPETKAVLWQKKENNFIQCNVCYNRCVLAPGKVGRCFSRKNVDGEMQLCTYGLISSMAMDPIEKKPLYHFHPGTFVFSIGSWGCNFSCIHCQNWQISQMSDEKANQIIEKESQFGSNIVSPDKLIELAIEHGAQGISWTYNEPAIWLEYTIDSAKIAKEKGLYTAYITNAYMTTEALDLINPYLDAFRVDLKSFDDKFYQEIAGVKNAKGVYETTLHAKKLGKHIECVTNIIPGKNDSEENLTNIAQWMANNLGKDTPWHVTRFFPCYKLKDIPITPVETIDKAVNIGHAAGLNFVYKGNVGGESKTVCPDCGKTAIKREFEVEVDTTPTGHCKQCGRDLYIVR